MTEDRIDKLESKLDGIDARTIDILKLLKDDDFGQPGLVTSHNYNKKRLNKLEKRVDQIYWVAGGIALVISLITAIVSIAL